MNKLLLSLVTALTFWVFIIITACNKNTSADSKPNHGSSLTTANEINELLRLACVAYDSFGNLYLRDSLLDVALNKAISKNNHRDIALAYSYEIKYSTAVQNNPQKARDYYNAAFYNTQKVNDIHLNNEVNLAYASYFVGRQNAQESRKYLEMIPDDLVSDNSDHLKKVLGKAAVFNIEDKPFEELKSLLNVMYQSLESNQDSIYEVCLLRLSDFYYFDQQYDKSLEYLDKYMNRILKNPTLIDSNKIYFLNANKLSIYNQQFDENMTIKLAESTINYARKHGYMRLEEMAQSQIRTTMISKSDVSQIKKYYTQNPTYLQELEKKDQSIFYRMKAYIAMANGYRDSAVWYFNEGEKYLNGNDYAKANFYHRKGDFYSLLGDLGQKILNYQKAHVFAKNGEDMNLRLKLVDSISQYYHRKNDITNEIVFLREKDSLNSQLLKVKNEQNIRHLELNNILALKELEYQKEQEILSHKHNLQNQIIALIVTLILMILVFLTYFNVPKWWIRSMGYISFIIFFEFIILLFDQWLHHATHGEPFKMMLARVLLLSILFPIHHWVEHTVVKYLLQTNKMNNLRVWLTKKRRLLWDKLTGDNRSIE